MKRSFEDQCDHIKHIIDSIPLDGSISVLTGSNGTGKSLVRSQLTFRVREHGKKIIHSSMALRTGSHAHLGGLGGLLRDSDYNSTSYETIRAIRRAIVSNQGNFLCLDEIEIGCSTEMVMGLVNWLNENLCLKDSLGCLVITHSPIVVKNLNFDSWFNMDDYETPEAWLTRSVEPIDVLQYTEEQNRFFDHIQRRMKSK